MFRVYGGSTVSRSIENARFDIIINMFPYTAKSIYGCVGEYCFIRIEDEIKTCYT